MAAPVAREEFVALCGRLVPQAHVEFVDDGKNVHRTVQDAIRRGATLIAAAGGDGTINAVATALIGSEVVLGVLPLGTLNHFSRDVGIPQELEAALGVLNSGVVSTIDVGTVNGRIFLNNSGLGLYPDMVHNRVQRQKRGLSKWPAMFVESARAFARFRLLRLQILIDGKALVRRTPAVFVGNNEYSLEDTLAAKRETLVDGNLCLYIPHPDTRLGLVWFSLRAFLGSPKADGGFDKFLTTEFSIQSHHRQVRVSIDGEVVLMQPPLEYRSQARSLRVIVPAGATAVIPLHSGRSPVGGPNREEPA